VTALASADSWISAWAPTSNAGTSFEMYVRSGNTYKALVRIILPSSVVGKHIRTATLRVWVSGRSNAGTGTLAARVLRRAWGETTVTWNVPWGLPGALAASDADAIAVGSTPLNATGLWVDVDVTPAVQAWADGTANNGLLLTYESQGSTEYVLASNRAVSKEPRIVISYDP
jgi:hypothetical protein